MLIHINATEQFKNNKKGIAILKKLIDKAYHIKIEPFDIKTFLLENKVLILPVCKQWFDLMETGEKTSEFRKPSKFIKDRLYNKNGSTKQYDYVLIINGYGYHRPYFISKYEGFGTNYDVQYTFSDGSKLNVFPEDYNIFLGEIIKRVNVKKK
jgi:hypothetical protein